nr:unnamed protein product [Rangifer tarandus platyrhynchus]
MGARRPPARHRRRRVINGDAAVRGMHARARGPSVPGHWYAALREGWARHRRSTSTRGPPASPHGPASENLGSGPIALILPGPVREGVQAGDRRRHAAGEEREPVLRGRLGGLPRGGDGGEQQPGSHQALLSLSGVPAAGRPRAPRLCEATAPLRGVRAQRLSPG